MKIAGLGMESSFRCIFSEGWILGLKVKNKLAPYGGPDNVVLSTRLIVSNR